MNKEFQAILQSVKEKKFAPVYLIDGEEVYYTDILTKCFEEQILTEAERDFNLLVLYGKDVSSVDVINTCHRLPMFAPKQVVIIKDAAQMKDLKELAAYVEHANPSTILLIEHRFKKVDGKLKLVKLVKDKGYYFTAEKIKEEDIPGWIERYGASIGFQVAMPEAQLLAGYLGDDLQKIVNEIDKVRINVPEEKQLTSKMIQTYIGINREYNLFEFPVMLTTKNKDKLYKMLTHFVDNPKAAPMPLIVGAMYAHLNTVYQAQALGNNEKELMSVLRLYKDRLRDTVIAARNLPSPKIEMCFDILADYSAKMVGVNSTADDRALLKELVAKMELAIGA